MHIDGHAPVTTGDFTQRFAELADQVQRTVYGKDDVIEKALICLLAGGHLLLDDRPGVGKTTLARALAGLLQGGRVSRIQGTPDLLPSDITGFSVYERKLGDFTFRAGPVSANIVLFDEINRCAPRTQSAMLEAMQDPQETLGTYPLPEAQLDRFLMRLSLGYPDRDAARDLLKTHGGQAPRRADQDQSEKRWPESTFLEMRNRAAALRLTLPLPGRLAVVPAVLAAGAAGAAGLGVILAGRRRGGLEMLVPAVAVAVCGVVAAGVHARQPLPDALGLAVVAIVTTRNGRFRLTPVVAIVAAVLVAPLAELPASAGNQADDLRRRFTAPQRADASVDLLDEVGGWLSTPSLVLFSTDGDPVTVWRLAVLDS